MSDLCVLFSFENRTFSKSHTEPHTGVCGSLCAILCEFFFNINLNSNFFISSDKFSLLPFSPSLSSPGSIRIALVPIAAGNTSGWRSFKESR